MVKVNVSEGIIEGEVVDNIYGGQFYSFKGIPYAEPPVGNLRFKAPQPKKPWTGIRSAKEFGPICYQINPRLSDSPVGSEDCLYLNIYTPSISPPTALPVMFWIHGGAFITGHSDRFEPEFLIKHNVILVTCNYRLEALGFLCLDTEDISGNAGAKDQVAAMRWVKKNINNFGGDRNNITVFGESAGAACVSYHLISPMTKGLFKRAIMQSGTMANWWSLTFEPRERALKLAKQLGCNSEDDKELGEFFRSVHPEKLVGLNIHVTQSVKLYELHFALVDEKQYGNNERFFHGDVDDVLKNGICKDVEILSGYTEDEGVIAFGFSGYEKIFNTANDYLEFFVPKQIQLNHPIKTQLEVARKVKEFYFNKDSIVNESNKWQLFKYINMDMFTHGILLFSKILSKGNKLYLYKLSCKSERNVMVRLFNLSRAVGDKPITCHADDLYYLFPMRAAIPAPVDQDSDTYTYIQKITTLWTNFAKYGNPTPDASLGVNLLPYSEDNQHYLNIGNTLETGTAPDDEEFAFWDSLFKQYLPSWSEQ